MSLIKGLVKRLFPNVNSDQPFDRLVEDEMIKAQTYDKLLLDKLKSSIFDQ
jgi:hypothetical protein